MRYVLCPMSNLIVLFSFESSDISLLEIKRLDLPAGASLGDIYKWLVIFKKQGTLLELEFTGMAKKDGDEGRSFSQGKLWFNLSEARLKLAEGEYQLLRQNPSDVSTAAIHLVCKHLGI